MSRVGNQTSCPLKIKERERKRLKKQNKKKKKLVESLSNEKKMVKWKEIKECWDWKIVYTDDKIMFTLESKITSLMDTAVLWILFLQIKRFKTQFISFKHDVDNITLFLTKECPISTGHPPNWWNVRIRICDINDNRLGDKQSYSR